jgi:hypothetical protein
VGQGSFGSGAHTCSLSHNSAVDLGRKVPSDQNFALVRTLRSSSTQGVDSAGEAQRTGIRTYRDVQTGKYALR